MNRQEFVQLLGQVEEMENYQIVDRIKQMSDEIKAQMLLDTDFITNYLHLKNHQISDIIKTLASEETKVYLLDQYPLEQFEKIEVIVTFSVNRKLQIVLEDTSLTKLNIVEILKSLDTKTLGAFFVEHQDFLKENAIHPYKIIQDLEVQEQKDFVANLEGLDLTKAQKKEILATLSAQAKREIDAASIPEEYRAALSIEKEEYATRIEVDLERNLEDYRYLDNLIKVNPEEFTKEQREQLMQLCDICPNLHVASILNIEYLSTGREYKEAEEWITSVIDKLKPEYTQAQKMAVIDNEIGNKISYSPDFDTEVYGEDDTRALWKIISLGYGVCNGIAKVEQYILGRVGIESEIISSGRHAFLKVKDVELPAANGEMVKGNTIIDPTWNLTQHRFKARPNNFCISYEMARQNDIDEEGKDQACHKNDEELQDATLSLEEQSLRKLFASVGLVNKDGSFPIKSLIEESKKINELYAGNPKENIEKQFLLLAQACPEFATCQNSSITMLHDVLLNYENLNLNQCVVNRVYSKADKEKSPVLFVYFDSAQLGKSFYIADKQKGQFIAFSQEEFTKQFECYETDLQKHQGLRPWESNTKQKETIDLSKTSGRVSAREGEER